MVLITIDDQIHQFIILTIHNFKQLNKDNIKYGETNVLKLQK